MRDTKINLKAWLKLLLFLTDEIAIVAAVILLLWIFDVHLHIGVLISIAAVLGIVILLLHRMLWPVLSDRQTNYSSMVGLEAEVVSPLRSEGVVKVRGELWKAAVIEGEASQGQSVVIIGLDGLKLLVRHKDADGSFAKSQGWS
jgi:membrane-bound ClpP family serine protease